MGKNYKDKFNPNLIYSSKESKMVCSSYYIEVGRECYQYSELKDKKNDILVYSALLAGLNNPKSDTFSYPNSVIAERLAMDIREVRRSINNLEKLDLIRITRPDNDKRNIKINVDLRYPPKETKKYSPKKSVIKVYDRIFYYPMITKPMVHLYSYYLALSSISQYQHGCDVSYKKAAESLGYSERQLMKILHNMENIGLVSVKRGKTSKWVSLKVDFSKKQPEEVAYEEELAGKEEQARTEQEQREDLGGQSQVELDDSSIDSDGQVNRPPTKDTTVSSKKKEPIRPGSRFTAEDFDW